MNKIQDLYPSNFKRREQRNYLTQRELNIEALREKLIELENFIIKNQLPAQKKDLSEDNIKILNEKIFDLEEENRNIKDKFKRMMPEKDDNPIDSQINGDFSKMKELENRMIELENHLTSKIFIKILAKGADNKSKNEFDKKFKENLLTKNNIITGSSADNVNFLTSKNFTPLISKEVCDI